MFTLSVDHDFSQWRDLARTLLCARVAPEDTLWEVPGESSLFCEEAPALPPPEIPVPQVPREFLMLAETVAHHRSPQRWGHLYHALWRLTLGREPHLLKKSTDPEVARLFKMRKEIARDIHKMHAFVRFKKTGEDSGTGREQFMAWFEPDHRIMPLTARFFQKRFTGMDWAIFTPTGSAAWDGRELCLGPGVAKVEVPEEELDELWRGYYRSIFNPARLKVKAMQAEMPQKYWKNLPESELIASLISESRHRTDQMHQEAPRRATSGGKNPYLGELRDRSRQDERIVRQPDDHIGESLSELRVHAACCQACPLYRPATATVMGEGPPDAEIMIVGEQPGDQEDLLGRPFVGPAGQLLDRALEAAGIDRSAAYLTNAVKHFKFTTQGKRRLHQSPAPDEISRCKPWLVAELLQVKPRTLILLGATAAKSLIDPNFRITRQRGLVPDTGLAERVIATVHPSYLLRLPDPTRQNAEKRRFLEDLRLALD